MRSMYPDALSGQIHQMLGLAFILYIRKCLCAMFTPWSMDKLLPFLKNNKLFLHRPVGVMFYTLISQMCRGCAELHSFIPATNHVIIWQVGLYSYRSAFRAHLNLGPSYFSSSGWDIPVQVNADVNGVLMSLEEKAFEIFETATAVHLIILHFWLNWSCPTWGQTEDTRKKTSIPSLIVESGRGPVILIHGS